jgi:predicted metal-dependent hydrolase
MTEIIVAAITGVATVIAVVLTNSKSNAAVSAKLDKSQGITDTKLEELTREVREHNNFARRMPVVEEQIKVINHRISDLERKEK